MQKADIPRLIQRLVSQPLPRGKVLGVVSDEAIFSRLFPLALARESGGERPLRFSGKAPAQAFLEHASQGGMFSEPAPCLVQWDTKLTAKQWEAEVAFLGRIPNPVPLACAFVFPLAFRTIIKDKEEQALPWLEWTLCWAPAEQEALRAADALYQRFETLAPAPATTRQSHVLQAVEFYSGDLAQVDSHFERMSSSGQAFEDCFAGAGDVSAFEVVEAMARCDAPRLFLRLRQCEEAGESPSALLAALSYFLRQVAQVHGALETQGARKDLRAAFDDAHVPFPSQARVQKALGVFPPERLARFFFLAAPLELTLRTHRDPFGLLAVELSALLG